MAFRSRPPLLIAPRRPLDTGGHVGAPLAARIMAGLIGDCTPRIQHRPALSAIINWLIDTVWPVKWVSSSAREKPIVDTELTRHNSVERIPNIGLGFLPTAKQRRQMKVPTMAFPNKAFWFNCYFFVCFYEASQPRALVVDALKGQLFRSRLRVITRVYRLTPKHAGRRRC